MVHLANEVSEVCFLVHGPRDPPLHSTSNVFIYCFHSAHHHASDSSSFPPETPTYLDAPLNPPSRIPLDSGRGDRRIRYGATRPCPPST
ncbi:hypothetical protein P691DRAFT_805312 [Macrolepiota fuliginosa MF-IS2]|uniref:Uncharacterized protein n=1 Tax=Macrolepiota fuliginosa MF-IS2 TaxID=1400762 RepID=A0A9P5X722_9AGAR|nr:hypothetical protein P691DRAFT_805312 [Macrolepiota fuliginosa MF-IS2]